METPSEQKEFETRFHKLFTSNDPDTLAPIMSVLSETHLPSSYFVWRGAILDFLKDNELLPRDAQSILSGSIDRNTSPFTFDALMQLKDYELIYVEVCAVIQIFEYLQVEENVFDTPVGDLFMDIAQSFRNTLNEYLTDGNMQQGLFAIGTVYGYMLMRTLFPGRSEGLIVPTSFSEVIDASLRTETDFIFEQFIDSFPGRISEIFKITSNPGDTIVSLVGRGLLQESYVAWRYAMQYFFTSLDLMESDSRFLITLNGLNKLIETGLATREGILQLGDQDLLLLEIAAVLEFLRASEQDQSLAAKTTVLFAGNGLSIKNPNRELVLGIGKSYGAMLFEDYQRRFLPH